MDLSDAEEKLMQHLWELEKAFLNDLLEMYPDPKPAKTTVATLLKRMIEKGYVDYKQLGRSREYYPLIPKSEYFSKHFSELIRDFFNNSTAQFASFFTSETDLSKSELQDLKKIVEKEIKRKEK